MVIVWSRQPHYAPPSLATPMDRYSRNDRRDAFLLHHPGESRLCRRRVEGQLAHQINKLLRCPYAGLVVQPLRVALTPSAPQQHSMRRRAPLCRGLDESSAT
jgi:hypothetical protein